MQLSREQVRAAWVCDKRRERRRLAVVLLVTAAVFLLCLCFRYNACYYEDKFVPAEYFKSLTLSVRLAFSRLIGGSAYLQRDALIGAVGESIYYGALAQVRLTLMSFVGGAALAVSGALFQTAYRNPMASPNMLGATAGVKLGNVLVVWLYSYAAVQQAGLRYQFCYGLTAVCVCLVLLLGKLAGDRRENFSVMEMVMAGSVLSQILNVFTMYLMFQLDEEEMVLYQQVSMGTYLQIDAASMTIFFTVMAVSVLPVLLVRYRMNITGLDRMETTALGLDPKPMRLLGQVCGVVMVTCAMIHCGEIGMVSMVIPYSVRQAVGSDFRWVCVYSALSGGVLLMLCRLLVSLFLIADQPVPAAFAVNLILMPAFMVILARRRSDVQ